MVEIVTELVVEGIPNGVIAKKNTEDLQNLLNEF